MIPVTKEIQRAYSEAWFRSVGMDEGDVQQMVDHDLRKPMPWRIAALAAVLALVERDHLRPTAAPIRCADCGRTARELIATQDADGGVAYLGPGCSRKRLQKALQRAEALPIGGER